MAYRGSTELSSVANPPRAVGGANMWGKRATGVISSTKVSGQNLWLYNTTDGSSELISTTYFTDAQSLGMRQGDLVMGSIDTGSTVSVYVGVVGVVSTLGAGLGSTGGVLSSTR